MKGLSFGGGAYLVVLGDEEDEVLSIGRVSDALCMIEACIFGIRGWEC